jgi:endonuclease/exonuclease/phosphatase family metal-dependent hydrolase
MRVASWNLLHGRSLDTGRVDESGLRAGATTLDADVVSLQEVDRHQARSSGSHQTAAVADAAGATWWRFVPSVWGEPGESGVPVSPGDDDDGERAAYGIGLVSRLPVLESDVLRFGPAPVGMPLLVPGQGLVKVADEPRSAIAAVVVGPTGPFTVIASHLSFVPGFNVRQLRRLVAWAQLKPAPRLLLADLNLPGRLPRAITGWTQLARVATYPSWRPRVQLDHALADGLGEDRVTRVESRRLPVSDHNALSLTLDL